MKANYLQRPLSLATLVILIAAHGAHAATLASDNASHFAYDSGWFNGNGGSGFSSWTLTGAGANSGYFIGSSTTNAAGAAPGIDTDGLSWGIFANSGALTAAFRFFGGTPLEVGQAFQISLDNGYIDGGSTVGFTLKTGSANSSPADYNNGARFEFLYIGADASNSYKVVDAGGLRNIGVPFTGTGLNLTFILTTPTSYTLRVTDNASSASTLVTGGLETGDIRGCALYNRNAGSGSSHDAYFNSMAILNAAPSGSAGSLDCGGKRVTASGITIDGSIGGIGGVSTGGSPLKTAKHGYAGQLTEVASVTPNAAPNPVNEGANTQLGGVAGMDDGTVTRIGGAEMKWKNPTQPISYISPAGLASLNIIWRETVATVTGSYLGVTGTGDILVYDTDPDNYGSYSGDGLPDWWQGGHFGLDNTNAWPGANPDGDAFNNRDEYIADTDPDNPTSYFHIANMDMVSPACSVSFLSSPSRKYSLSWCSSLAPHTWWGVKDQTNVWGSGEMKSLSDTNASSVRMYNVTVQMP